MAGVTNRGKIRVLDWAFRASVPAGAGLAMFLATSAVTPTADTNLFSDLTEIATGNGYATGGNNINRDSTDWDVLTEDDVNDRGLIQLRDMVWTASGGPIPASGSGARWSLLTDRNATIASREIVGFFDLGADRSVSDTQSLTLRDCEVRLTE